MGDEKSGGTPSGTASPAANPPSAPAGNPNTPAAPSSQPNDPAVSAKPEPTAAEVKPSVAAPKAEEPPAKPTQAEVKPAPASEQLLADLPPEEPVKPAQPIPKPTREALKLPEKHFYTEEDLADILSGEPTQEAAQKAVDRGTALINRSVERLIARNQKWIAELKDDPELGGAKWEESKALYAKGVVQRFGRDFAAALRELHLDAHPAIVKDVVRAMRASQPKPIVSVENPPLEDKPVTFQGIAEGTYGYMKPGSKQPAPTSSSRGLS